MSDNNNNAQDQESPITEPLTSTATTTATTAMNQDTKVLIILKPVGDAPLLKKTKYKIAATSQFSEVIVFVRKRLNVQPDQSLVCNSSRFFNLKTRTMFFYYFYPGPPFLTTKNHLVK